MEWVEQSPFRSVKPIKKNGSGGDKETATEGSPDERGQGDEGAREDLQIDQKIQA